MWINNSLPLQNTTGDDKIPMNKVLHREKDSDSTVRKVSDHLPPGHVPPNRLLEKKEVFEISTPAHSPMCEPSRDEHLN